MGSLCCSLSSITDPCVTDLVSGRRVTDTAHETACHGGGIRDEVLCPPPHARRCMAAANDWGPARRGVGRPRGRGRGAGGLMPAVVGAGGGGPGSGGGEARVPFHRHAGLLEGPDAGRVP